MPAPAGTKRVKGISIYRPFVYGSIAKPLDPLNRPPNISAEHTHQWTVYVRGVDGEDISYWLKKVQFKLHETYTNSLRTIEAPPFEVTETGWGEFEVSIKLHFIPEANEKAQTMWHALKLHPYGPDADGQRERREAVLSQNYEEIIFNEPVEAFYEVLTAGVPQPPARSGKSFAASSKGSKQSTMLKGRGANAGERSAEIPYAESVDNPYCQKTEGKELDRLNEAIKTVEAMVKEERRKLEERERVLEGLRREGAGSAVKAK
ncbi:MAG: histone acetyltransferase subunit (Yaf9) [Lasallia pustulata]|uniref:Protein AF-9 homolog n=1 Tax=Lasallia pustulata TaxID=136370 RepID=A0A5M8PRZ4_9LECA|nr:MAG: histone acetyltransferase subunit (Yaf9) [Lasallia pustulata]